MPRRKLYSLTPEHRAQLAPWCNKWIANAMSTKAMDDADRSAMVEAIHGLYDAARLARPKHIVFVPSPFVLRFAGGFAAAIWKNARAATNDATNDATWSRCQLASIVAWVASAGEPGLWWSCAEQSYRMWQCGNQWSAWDSYLSFFRHIAKLGLPEYESYRHWESASIHGGPRIIHPDFCMVSDRPELLTVDSQNRPHGEDGPFCRWRDGSSLYSWHGVRVPAWIIERPQDITPAKIEAEANAEVRRAMMERFGWDRYIIEGRFDKVHTDDFGTLYRKRVGDEDVLVVRVIDPSTGREYGLPVHPELMPLGPDGPFGEPQALTARGAVASTFGKRAEEYAPAWEA